MIARFLKAKHWQLFLLTFGIPMVFQFVMVGIVISNISTNTNPNPAMIFNQMKFFSIIMLVFMGLQWGWLWSIAVGLQKKIPRGIKMKVKRFKILFFIPIIYIFLIITFMAPQMKEVLTSGTEPNGVLIGSLFAIIIPLHLFSMLCIFYSFYFVAKTFKTAELQKEVSFSDFIGEFFLIWFYPIGIWIIQSKVNKMTENNENAGVKIHHN